MKRFVLSTVAAMALGALVAPAAIGNAQSEQAKSRGAKTWRVTIQNLTPPGPGAPGSQPLSPPLFVVHSNGVHVWRVGAIASHVVAAIAEDADNAPAVSAYTGFRGVESVFTGAGGPIPSGGSSTYMVHTRGKFDRLSLVTMLVNTNDGFTGLDSLLLRGHGRTLEKMAYDAGSEKNNQLKADIPGPCCGHAGVRDPEGAPIHAHPGILPNVGDLDPATYGWSGPVARIMVERVP